MNDYNTNKIYLIERNSVFEDERLLITAIVPVRYIEKFEQFITEIESI